MFTLGLVDEKDFYRIGVTDRDRANGYDAANLGSRLALEAALMLVPGSGAVNAAGWLGRVARTVTRVETVRDLATGVEGAYGILSGQSTGENTLKLLGFLGYRGNLKALNKSGFAGRFEQGLNGLNSATHSLAQGIVRPLVHNPLTRLTGTHDVLQAWAKKAGFQACFTGRMPVRTPTGRKRIEKIRAGDLVLSRDENDPRGLVVAQTVEEVFVRLGAVWSLRVQGQEIETTPEHPFFAEGRGWTACAELVAGERVMGEEGEWLTVDAVEDTGRYETVYNFRVADYHTYFVGDEGWGFSVWAHNTECGGAARLTKQQRLAEARKWADTANQRAIHPDLPEPASFSALTKKQKELVRKSAREEGMLADEAVVLHGNSPTKTPGVQYELRRLDGDQARQAAGFKDWEAGSVAKIGETTYFRDVGGRVVQQRYTSEQLRGLQFVVTRRGPQTAMREAEAASIASYVERFGNPPELNIAAATGKGYR